MPRCAFVATIGRGADVRRPSKGDEDGHTRRCLQGERLAAAGRGTGPTANSCTIPAESVDVTLLWFVVWLIADHIGAHEPLHFDPVNVWSATLLLGVALDLGRAHAGGKLRSQ